MKTWADMLGELGASMCGQQPAAVQLDAALNPQPSCCVVFRLSEPRASLGRFSEEALASTYCRAVDGERYRRVASAPDEQANVR